LNPDHLRDDTRAALDAIELALALIARHSGEHDLRSKGDHDLVTATDLAVEDAVRGLIEANTKHPVVGEERGGSAGVGDATYWLLDPICGTRNLASGIPLYCVNLALVEDSQVTVAVVGNPPANEILVAELGQGAWVVRRDDLDPIAVSDRSQTVVFEDSHADPQPARRERAAHATAAAITAFRWELRMLSTTLALPYVAVGRVAGYVLFWTTLIHAAAGSLLVSEAGGVVSDINGVPWTVNSDSIVASANRTLHADLLQVARP
jgi:myo-inositol-1(or 4)-monophosphatase